MTAPLALFVYNRPWHTQQTVEALQRNELAADTDIHIFSDAPKNASAARLVADLRRYICSIRGFRSVTITQREFNLGLADSIIDGVTRIVNRFGRVIVLEDDLITSPFFLKYMNEGLDIYGADNQVISVHGYTYPVSGTLPETFFTRGADCWGWGTWKRGWDLFEHDSRKLLADLRRRGLEEEFNLDGAINYVRMLERQIAGKNQSWAIRWHATAFILGALTLNPGRSLVHNIGTDQSGTHCGKTDMFRTTLSERPITVNRIAVEESPVARELIKTFLETRRPSIRSRVIGKLWRFAGGMR